MGEKVNMEQNKSLKELLKRNKAHSHQELIKLLNLKDEIDLAIKAIQLIRQDMTTKPYINEHNQYLEKSIRLLNIPNDQMDDPRTDILLKEMKQTRNIIRSKIGALEYHWNKSKKSDRSIAELEKRLNNLSTKLESAIANLNLGKSHNQAQANRNRKLCDSITEIILDAPHEDCGAYGSIIIRLFENIPSLITQRSGNGKIILENLLDQYCDKTENATSEYTEYLQNIIVYLLSHQKQTGGQNKEMRRTLEQHLQNSQKKDPNHQFLKSVLSEIKQDHKETSNKSEYELSKEAQLNLENMPKINQEKYYDLTSKNVITIDSEGTISRDDGISIEKLSNGNYLLGIYIIDVAAYVPLNSHLYQDAINNASHPNSIPMLPTYLCKDICTIKAHHQRLAIAHFYEYTPDFQLVNEHPQILKAIISAKANLEVRQIDKIASNKDHELYEIIKQLIEITQNIAIANPNIDEYHRQKSEQRSKKANYSIKHDNSLGNNIVKYLMILNNQSIAHLASSNQGKYPFIFRNNTQFNPSDILAQIKHQFPKDIEIKETLNRLSTPVSNSTYSTISKGHAGLGFKDYTHISTPGRSVASLTAQHLEKKFMIDKHYDEKTMEQLQEWLLILCQTVNEQNQKSPIAMKRKKLYIPNQIF